MATSVRAQVEWFLPDRRLGRHVLVYQRVGSTMEVAWELAGQGATEGTAVLAYEQSKGRGRFSRPWVAEPGSSLLMSVVMRPPVELAPRLAVVTGLAVAQAVERLAGVACTIKWPNDVRIHGKKVCGILIESRADTSGSVIAVVGVGLNLELDVAKHPELKGTATSLREAAGRSIEIQQAAEAVLQSLDTIYSQAMAGSDVIALWRGFVDTLGQRVTARWKEEEETGVAEDVTSDGSLVLRRDDGTKVLLPDAEVTLS